MSPLLFSRLLPWAAPPLLGAVVGYILSLVAARMLFRPLKPKRKSAVLGAEHSSIGTSVGRIVSRELLTEDALRKLLRSEKTMQAVARGLSGFTGSILDRPVSSLTKSGASPFLASLPGLLSGMLSRFFASRQFIYVVRDALSRLTDAVAGKTMQEVLRQVDAEALLTERLLPLLAQDENRQAISRSLAATIAGQAGAIISDDLLDRMSDALSPFIPIAVERLVQWLRSGETRAYMADRGRELVPKILEKLNVLQKLLLSAGQYDRRLTEQMPEIVDETINTLEGVARDPTQQRRILRLLVDIARDWRDSLLVSRMEMGMTVNESKERLADTAAALIERFLQRLEDPDARRALYAALETRLLAGNQTLGFFLRNTLGVQSADIVDSLSARALAALTKEQTADAIARVLAESAVRLLEQDPQATLGGILRIDASRKEKLVAFLVATILQTVDDQAQEILRSLEVESFISRKIDGLDARGAELLLAHAGIFPRRWISLAGAVIGCVVGLFQLLLRFAPWQ
ncbi:MAG: DUF445 family protein [Spirochaetia bacterium]